MEKGSFKLKVGLAEMLKGGVIMDVTNPEQAIIAEKSGAVAVMALEKIPADIRRDGGIARMTDPKIINEIKELAGKYDIMIIIGSFTSANSKRLTMLSKKINDRTYQVTEAKNINKIWFKGCETVGISAGASTPDYLIDEVKDSILSL